MARSTLADLIARIRMLIADTAGQNQQFADNDIQLYLDMHQNVVRYEPLTIAPSIVNAASTNNIPTVIFADYYSRFSNWEGDVVLQGQISSAAWKVLTPVASDLLVGHWQFELDVFNSGTIPGQMPPTFATGKIFDVWATSADLLDAWAASLSCAYDINVDGQNLQRSQLMTAKLALAQQYRMRAKPKLTKLVRTDVAAPVGAKRVRLLDDDDVWKTPAF